MALDITKLINYLEKLKKSKRIKDASKVIDALTKVLNDNENELKKISGIERWEKWVDTERKGKWRYNGPLKGWTSTVMLENVLRALKTEVERQFGITGRKNKEERKKARKDENVQEGVIEQDWEDLVKEWKDKGLPTEIEVDEKYKHGDDLNAFYYVKTKEKVIMGKMGDVSKEKSKKRKDTKVKDWIDWMTGNAIYFAGKKIDLESASVYNVSGHWETKEKRADTTKYTKLLKHIMKKGADEPKEFLKRKSGLKAHCRETDERVENATFGTLLDENYRYVTEFPERNEKAQKELEKLGLEGIAYYGRINGAKIGAPDTRYFRDKDTVYAYRSLQGLTPPELAMRLKEILGVGVKKVERRAIELLNTGKMEAISNVQKSYRIGTKEEFENKPIGNYAKILDPETWKTQKENPTNGDVAKMGNNVLTWWDTKSREWVCSDIKKLIEAMKTAGLGGISYYAKLDEEAKIGEKNTRYYQHADTVYTYSTLARVEPHEMSERLKTILLTGPQVAKKWSITTLMPENVGELLRVAQMYGIDPKEQFENKPIGSYAKIMDSKTWEATNENPTNRDVAKMGKDDVLTWWSNGDWVY